PPVDVDVRDFLVHYLPAGTHVPNVFVQMYDYHINPVFSENPLGFPDDMEWQIFSHTETDTEFFISTETVPRFGQYEDALVGVTRFMGSAQGDVYALHDDEWHFIAQMPIATVVPLENQSDGAENRERSTAFSANGGLSLKRNGNIGIVGSSVSTLPHVLATAFNWLGGSVTEIQTMVENPFTYDYFSGFAWGRLLASFDKMDWDTNQAIDFVDLLSPMIDLRAESKITDELIAQMEAFYDELEELTIDDEDDFDLFGFSGGTSSSPTPIWLRDHDDWDDKMEIQYALCSYDGVGGIAFSGALKIATMAGNYARDHYGEDDWVPHHFGPFWEKALRHFTFTFSMASLNEPLFAGIAKNISTNREWAETFADRIPAVYRQLLNEGYSSREARSESNALAIRIREEWIDLFLSNRNFFTRSVRRYQHLPSAGDATEPFRDSTVMFNILNIVDFTNNAAGLKYAAQLNPNGTSNNNLTSAKDAFDMAVANGDIRYSVPHHTVTEHIDGYGYYRLDRAAAIVMIWDVHDNNWWHTRELSDD
ncbi:MAG: hypothetical protein FWD19_00830, partial [Defluviitaleaceae bacterium]|nr:hypothetical protein [Defluviitaleaceae bacterium]